MMRQLELYRYIKWDRISLYTSLELICGLGFILYIIFIATNINKGIDLSDTGFYYISIFRHDSLNLQVTQFGAIWSILPLPSDIFTHRVVHLFFVFTSGAYCLDRLVSFAVLSSEDTHAAKWAVWAAGGGVGCLIYFLWIPDPSYNSLASIFITALLGLAVDIGRADKSDLRYAFGLSSLAGVAYLGLALTKAPSAAVLILPLIAIVLASRGVRPMELAIICAGGLVGAALLLALIEIRVMPLTQMFSQMISGVENLVQHERTASQQLAWLADDLKRAFSASWPAMIGLAIGIGMMVAGGLQGRSLVFKGGVIFALLATAAALICAFTAHIDNYSMSRRWATFVFFAALVGAAWTATVCLVTASRPSGDRQMMRWRPLIAISSLFVAIVAQTAFTADVWFSYAGLQSPSTLLLFLLGAKLVDARALRGSFAMASLIVVAGLFVALSNMSDRPYRLNGTLADQAVPAQVLDGTLLLHPDSARFLEQVGSRVSDEIPPGERPILIDTSGRFPLLHVLLPVEPLPHPWPLSGYRGSQSVFEKALDDLTEAQLNSAWVLVAPDSRLTHDLSALDARGLALDADFTLVVEAYSPYLETRVRIFRPIDDQE